MSIFGRMTSRTLC